MGRVDGRSTRNITRKILRSVMGGPLSKMICQKGNEFMTKIEKLQ